MGGQWHITQEWGGAVRRMATGGTFMAGLDAAAFAFQDPALLAIQGEMGHHRGGAAMTQVMRVRSPGAGTYTPCRTRGVTAARS